MSAKMKVLSGPAGDGLLTNAEVMHWLREKQLDALREVQPEEYKLRPPRNATEISNEILSYFEKSPSGNQTVESVGKLFEKLRKFKLSDPELVMIANIRPEAYAHITPLIVDIHNRFDEDQVYRILLSFSSEHEQEMLEIVKTTLEPRPQIESDVSDATATQGNGVAEPGTEGSSDPNQGPAGDENDTAGVSIDTLNIATDSAAMED